MDSFENNLRGKGLHFKSIHISHSAYAVKSGEMPGDESASILDHDNHISLDHLFQDLDQVTKETSTYMLFICAKEKDNLDIVCSNFNFD